MLVLNAVFSVEDAVYQRSSDVEDIWDFTSRIGCRSPQKRVPWPCGDFVLWMCQPSHGQLGELRESCLIWSQESWRVNLHTVLHLSDMNTWDVSWNTSHLYALVFRVDSQSAVEFWLQNLLQKRSKGLPTLGGATTVSDGRVMNHTCHTCVFFLSSVNWNNMNMIWSLTTTIASLHHPSDISETKIHNFPVNKAAGSPWKCRKLGGLKVTLQHFFLGSLRRPRDFYMAD